MDLRLLPGVAGNLKSFLTDGDMESKWSSLLGDGCSSDWGALSGPAEELFLSGGTGGIGGSAVSTEGAFVIVD